MFAGVWFCGRIRVMLLVCWCLFGLLSAFAGIREAPTRRRRCPCAGRHLLFFAAAKKSRQKKAAHPEPLDHYPRAPNVPVSLAATRESAPVASALVVASPTSNTRVAASNVAPSLQTVCRPSHHPGNPRAATGSVFQPVRCRVWRDNLHTVCRKWAVKVRQGKPLYG